MTTPGDIRNFVEAWAEAQKIEAKRKRRRARRLRFPNPARWDMLNMLIAIYGTIAFVATAGLGAGVTLLIQWLRGRR